MQPAFLCSRGGNDQLATAPVADAMTGAEFVEQMAAGNAQFCLERAGRVIKPGVDDFTVACACFATEGVVLFEDYRIDAALCQRCLLYTSRCV